MRATEFEDKGGEIKPIATKYQAKKMSKETENLTSPIEHYAEAIKWRLSHLAALCEGKPQKTQVLELESDFMDWMLKFEEVVKVLG